MLILAYFGKQCQVVSILCKSRKFEGHRKAIFIFHFLRTNLIIFAKTRLRRCHIIYYLNGSPGGVRINSIR